VDRETLLVLGQPGERLLAKLNVSAAPMDLVVAGSPDAIERAAPSVTVILGWSWEASGDLLRQALLLCPNVRWVSS
jgi:hypothetical protein